MQRLTRYGTTAALGAALALAGACGKHDSATDSAVAVDSAAAATNTTGAPVAPPVDSATAAAPGSNVTSGALTAPNALAMIALSNGAEIQTSQIALDKATSADVKAYAKAMVADHQAMQKEADAVAAKAGLTPQPPAQAEQKRAAGDQLVQQLNSTAKGADFDRAYVDGQVQAHQQTLSELQQMQTSVDNADVKALIEKAIPKVQDHLARAQKLQSGTK